MIQKYILPKPFFISLFIGLLMCYVLTPPPKIICKHPTPENLEDVYQDDKEGNCYKYEAEKVQCPNNKEDIKETPVSYKCKK